MGALHLLEGVRVIETGGGMRVWERPPLQGITDWELSWPSPTPVLQPNPKETITA